MNTENRNPMPLRWLDGLWLDLMHGISGLWNRPAFTLTAVFSLALGIGANSAIFSILDGMFLRPPVIERPGELVRLFSTNSHGADVNTSVQDFRDFCERTRTLSGIVSTKDMFVSYHSGAQSRFFNSLVVSENYFEILKPPFALGRGFAPADLREDRTWPAVIGYETWKKELGGSPQVIGKDLLL